MSVKKRTSISLDESALDRGREMAEALGYPSLSEYLEYLIQRDAEEQRPHVVIRDRKGVRHTTKDKE